jgi:ABC-type amino acid transport substrate-binding protein
MAGKQPPYTMTETQNLIRRAGTFVMLMLVIAGILTRPVSAQSATDTTPSADKIVVRVKPIAPFVMGDKEHLRGFSIDLWNEIARRTALQFQYHYVETINELLDGVENGSADVAIAAVTITADREKLFDFSHPYYHSGLQIMTRKSGTGILSAVTRVLWSIISAPAFYAGIMVFLGFVFVAANFFWMTEHKTNDAISTSYFRGLWDATWWAIVTVTTVGYGDRTPATDSGRVIAITWIVLGYLGFAWFTATVTSIVTVTNLTGTIDGPGSLAGHKVATVRRSTALSWLAQNVPGAQPRIYSSIEIAYDRLLAGEVDAVVFDAPSVLYFANHRGRGRTRLVGAVFHSEEYGIVLTSGSPLREKVNQALLKITEDGTWAQLKNRWFGLGTIE